MTTRTHNWTAEELTELEAQKAWVRIAPKECPRCGRRQYTCRADCAMRSVIHAAHDDDRKWFKRHPAATERVRPWTVEEALGYFLATGKACGCDARVVWNGQWWTENGRRTHKMLRLYDAD